jgi:hypothetical protein
VSPLDGFVIPAGNRLVGAEDWHKVG